MSVAPKRLIILVTSFQQNHFKKLLEDRILIKSQPSALPQIFLHTINDS